VEDFNFTRKALFHSTNFGEGIDYYNYFLSTKRVHKFRFLLALKSAQRKTGI